MEYEDRLSALGPEFFTRSRHISALPADDTMVVEVHYSVDSHFVVLMSRNRISSPRRASRDTDHLITLAQALNASGSRVEDRYWERLIEAAVGKLLRTGQDAAIEAALDHLLETDPSSSEVLLELCETLSESTTLEKDGQRYDVLLIVAPIAVWTRYSIPAGKIKTAALDALHAQLHGHILARDAQLALIPRLLSIDHMPLTFSATQQWMQRLGLQALGRNTTQKPTLPDVQDIPNMLADSRYLVGAVAVPEGAPIFRWQESPGDELASRETCRAQWVNQVEPTLATLLPGCGLDILLPDAWYVGAREADRSVRPLAIRAAVGWLSATLDTEPEQLRAIVAATGETHAQEYRIGFTLRNRNEVLYGCVWPVFGPDDIPTPRDGETPPEPQDHIADLLRAEGVTDIRRLAGLLPPDFCEDCGAPYFPDPTGEMVHAEMPEDADTAPAHFH